MFALFIVVAVIAYIVFITAASGFTIMTLWNWFIPTIFTSAPSLTFWSGLGLALVVSYFTTHISQADMATELDESDRIAILITPFAKMVFLLVLGWIVKGMM